MNDLEKCVTAASHAFAISPKKLFSRRRPKEIAEARNAVYYLALEMTRHTDSDIGKFMNRDRTTVLAGARRARNLADVHPEYRELLRRAVAYFKQPPSDRLAALESKVDKLEKRIELLMKQAI